MDEEEWVKEFKEMQFLLDKHDSTLVYITYYRSYSDTIKTIDTLGIDNSDILKYHRLPIRGEFLGQRIQVKFTVVRIDSDFSMPFFRLKYRNMQEIIFDE
jgi:hypothetical protein